MKYRQFWRQFGSHRYDWVARGENNCVFLGWPASANVVWFDEKITNGPVLTLTSQIVGDTKVL